MDVNDWRIVVTVSGFVLFIAIWAWAWSARRRRAFDEAARYPFLDDERSATADGEQR
jgi:cytochrome c oxidase cbb3-type subunit 4